MYQSLRATTLCTVHVHHFEGMEGTLYSCTDESKTSLASTLPDVHVSELTSQAVTLVAPARAAIIASSPVPVPISKTWGSFPAAFSWDMALSKAR